MSVLNEFARLLNTKIINLEPNGNPFFYQLNYASGRYVMSEEITNQTVDKFVTFSKREIERQMGMAESDLANPDMAESDITTPDKFNKFKHFNDEFKKNLEKLKMKKNDSISIPLHFVALFFRQHILAINPEKPHSFYITTPDIFTSVPITRHNILILLNTKVSGVVTLHPTSIAFEKPKFSKELLEVLNLYKEDIEAKHLIGNKPVIDTLSNLMKKVSTPVHEARDKKMSKKNFRSQSIPNPTLVYEARDKNKSKKNHPNPQIGLLNQRTSRNIRADGMFSFNQQQRNAAAIRNLKPDLKPDSKPKSRSNSIEVHPNNVEIIHNLGTNENPIVVKEENITHYHKRPNHGPNRNLMSNRMSRIKSRLSKHKPRFKSRPKSRPKSVENL